MARKTRSENLIERGKALAQRVDHQYFARPHPWRSSLKWCSIVLPVICCVAVLAIEFTPRGAKMYLPGPVSKQHVIFGDHCEKCHEQKAGSWGRVADAKCLSCHDGPAHSLQTVHFSGNIQKQAVNGTMVDVNTPNCVTCHTEHQGHLQLARINDGHCTQCHGDLERKDGKPPTIEPHIENFEDKHPEWEVLRVGRTDDTPYRLNHNLHTELDIWPDDVKLAATKNRTVLCNECHVPEKDGTHFQPITFNANCIKCHDMGKKFSPAIEPFGKIKFTHGDPKLVLAEIKSAVAGYLLQNGGEPALLNTKSKPDGDDDGDSKTAPAKVDKRTAEEWVHDKTAEVTKPLFFPESRDKSQKSCLKCHVVSAAAEGVIEISTRKIPTDWLPKSIFKHHTHRVLDCLSCHTQALNSKFTSDVLLPGIENCKQCHSQSSGGRSDCAECHQYHDRKLLRFTGDQTIHMLDGSADAEHPDKFLAPPRTQSESDAIQNPLNAADDKRLEDLKSVRTKWLEQENQSIAKRAADERAKRKTLAPPAVTPPVPVPEVKTIPVQTPAVVVPEVKPDVPKSIQPPATSIICGHCGKAWPLTAKYCGRCGIKIAPAGK